MNQCNIYQKDSLVAWDVEFCCLEKVGHSSECPQCEAQLTTIWTFGKINLNDTTIYHRPIVTPFPNPPAHGVSSPMAFLNSTARQWCKDVIAWNTPNPPDVMQPKCVNKFMACVTRVEGNQLIEVWTMLSRRLMWETSREKSAKNIGWKSAKSSKIPLKTHSSAKFHPLHPHMAQQNLPRDPPRWDPASHCHHRPSLWRT